MRLALLCALSALIASLTLAGPLDSLRVSEQEECPAEYNRHDYGRGYRYKEHLIAKANYGAAYAPYTGRIFPSIRDTPGSKGTQVEHIVALGEAHRSGACFFNAERKHEFAKDIDNLTLAGPKVNNAKSDLDAAGWMDVIAPNRCWFASTVVHVKSKWGLSVDPKEKAVLETEIRDHCPYGRPDRTPRWIAR